MTPPAASPPGLPGRRRTSVCRAGWRTVDDTGPDGTDHPDRRDDAGADVYVYVNYMVRLP